MLEAVSFDMVSEVGLTSIMFSPIHGWRPLICALPSETELRSRTDPLCHYCRLVSSRFVMGQMSMNDV